MGSVGTPVSKVLCVYWDRPGAGGMSSSCLSSPSILINVQLSINGKILSLCLCGSWYISKVLCVCSSWLCSILR